MEFNKLNTILKDLYYLTNKCIYKIFETKNITYKESIKLINRIEQMH